MLTEAIKKLYSSVPEIQLYYIINNQGGQVWATNHYLADHVRNMPESQVEYVNQNLRYTSEKLEFAVDQTTRFEVTTPRNGNQATDEYMAWFNKWDAYTKTLIGEPQDEIFEIFDVIGQAITAGNDDLVAELSKKLEPYRPEAA